MFTVLMVLDRYQSHEDHDLNESGHAAVKAYLRNGRGDHKNLLDAILARSTQTPRLRSVQDTIELNATRGP